MAVAVRRLERSEWPLLRTVRLQALADAPYAFGSTLAEEQDRDDTWWARSADELAWFVAVPGPRPGTRPVGLIAGMHAHEPSARGIISMWVDASHRGRGVASLLLDAVERWARAGGATALVLRVSDRNERARRFYARVGFALTGDSHPLHSDPTAAAVEMRRELPPARLRFAPSSSARLHAGHARSAALTWALARQLSGEYFVRFEDTAALGPDEPGRQAVTEDLAWLGLLGTAAPRVQRELSDAHRTALGQLSGAGRTYLDDGAVRFRLPAAGAEEWDDLVLGRVVVGNDQLRDPVLVRSAGTPTFVLASTVDDVTDGVTHLVRVDLMLRATAVQRHVWRALGAPPPVTAHTAALTGPRRAPLHGRGETSSATIAALRGRGVRASAVLLYCALPETASWRRPPAGLEDVIDRIDLRRVPHRPYVFDLDVLDRLNQRLARLHPDAR